MAGIDTILQKLKEENQAQCAEILRRAEEDAAAHLRERDAETDAQCLQIARDARRRADDLLRIANNSAEAILRRGELAARVAMIDRALDDALKSLESMSGPQFFDALESLLRREARGARGLLRLLPSDAEQMPEDYMRRLNDAIGGNLTPAPDAALPGRGAVVDCGDIEIDLTFRSLLGEKRDALKAQASAMLFAP